MAATPEPLASRPFSLSRIKGDLALPSWCLVSLQTAMENRSPDLGPLGKGRERGCLLILGQCPHTAVPNTSLYLHRHGVVSLVSHTWEAEQVGL